MCFWSEIAFFNCDGNVLRMKHLCELNPNDGRTSGAVMCNNYETPCGCKHSETARPIPHRAIYKHVCDEDSYRPPPGSGIPWVWKPAIKEPFKIYQVGNRANGGTIKNSLQFWWCDGNVSTLQDVFAEGAGFVDWRPIDLLQIGEEKRLKLVRGGYEHWVGVWSGDAEKQ